MPCIPSSTRTKGGVLLRNLRHARRVWIAAVLPLIVALNSRVALAENDTDAPTTDASASDAEAPDEAARDATTTDVPTADAMPVDASVPRKNNTSSSAPQLPPTESRWKTVGLGLGFAGVWYAGAWGLREVFWSWAPGAPDLRYPLVGPWMDLSKTGCPSNDTNCGTFGLVARTVLVVIDGIGQVGGIAIALDGLFTPTASHSAVQARRTHAPAAPQLSPIPVPWSTTGGGGLSFVGQF